MASGVPRFIFLFIFVLNCLLWSYSRFAEVPSRASNLSYSGGSFADKRGLLELQYANSTQYVETKDKASRICSHYKRSRDLCY